MNCFDFISKQSFPLRKMALPLRGRRRFTPTGIFPMLQTIRLELFYHNFVETTNRSAKKRMFAFLWKSIASEPESKYNEG